MRISRCLPFFTCLVAGLFLNQPAKGQLPIPASPDATFSDDGIATAILSGQVLRTHGMDVQADGGVILAGSAWGGGSTNRLMVTRLTATGAVDTGFGAAGFMTYAPNPALTYNARAVKVLANGRILVAGDVGNNSLVLLRLLADGSLDSSFSATILNVGNAWTTAGLAVQSDGKVLVAGQLPRSGGSDMDPYIFRIYSNGGIDSSFGNSGRYYLSNSNDHTVRALAVQADNKILYGGSLNSSQGYVARLNANGTTDTAFATSSGIYTFDLSTQSAEYTAAVAVEASQNILVLSSMPSGSDDVGIIRLLPTGQKDTLFSGDGQHTTRLGTASVPTGLVSQADGRILISGHSASGPDSSKFLLRRFLWNGNPDSSVGTDGLFGMSVSSGAVESAGVSCRDGKIVVGGTLPVETSFLRSAAAIRLHAGPDLPATVINIVTQPQNVETTVGQQVTLSVEATSPEALVYSWYRGTALAKRSNEPFYTFPVSSPSVEGSYHVVLTANNSTQTSHTVQVRVLQPPIIQAMAPVWSSFLNGYGVINTSVQGRRPITCRWFKGDVEVYSHVLTSYWDSVQLSINPVTADSAGQYRLEATNSDGTAVSDTVLHRVVSDPSVTLLGGTGMLVELGTSFILSADIHSSLEARIQWSKDGKAISSALDYSYSKEAVSMSDAGSYTVSVRSVRGKAVSNPIPLGVVDTRSRDHIFAVGKKHQISIPVAGAGMHFEWYQNDVKIEPRAGLTGLDSATLTFAKVQAGDAGDYACKVTSGEYELTTGMQKVILASGPPELDSVVLPTGRVAIHYQAQLALPEFASHFDIKGLPPGFSYSKTDHTISGRPMKAGRYPVTFSAVNSLGSSAKIKTTLVILDLPATRYGRFYNRLSDGYYEGDIDITITPTGTYTGKITLCNMAGKIGTASFKGVLDTGTPPENGAGEELGIFTGETTFAFPAFGPLQGKPSVQLRLTGDYLEVNAYMERIHSEGNYVMSFQTSMSHSPWSAKNPLAEAYRGVFNIGLSGIDYGPRGWSYGRATVSAAGTLAFAGTLSDGTPFTLSAPINVGYEAIAPRFLYGNWGLLAIQFGITPGNGGPEYLDAGISGTATWMKNASSLNGQKNYPVAFAGNMSVTGGAKYVPPSYDSLTGPLMLNAAPGENNVTATLFDYPASGQLHSNHTVRFSTGENPRGLKGLTFNASNGSFSGSGTYVFEEERYNPKTEEFYFVTIKQPYKFQGLVIRDPTALRATGVGFSLRLLPYETESGKIIKLLTSYPFEISPN